MGGFFFLPGIPSTCPNLPCDSLVTGSLLTLHGHAGFLWSPTEQYNALAGRRPEYFKALLALNITFLYNVSTLYNVTLMYNLGELLNVSILYNVSTLYLRRVWGEGALVNKDAIVGTYPFPL